MADVTNATALNRAGEIRGQITTPHAKKKAASTAPVGTPAAPK